MRRNSMVGLVLMLLLTAIPFPAVADPIDDIVGDISQANLLGHVSALEGQRATLAEKANARAYVAGQFSSYGYTVTVDASQNVIARLEGSVTPDSTFVLGAHYDTVFGSPGADDNGTGLAGMFEIARTFAGLQTGASIEFVAFADEELGLLGSFDYAEAAFQNSADIIGMISLDMIGFTGPSQIVFPDIPGCLDVNSTSQATGNFIAAAGNTAAIVGNFEAAAATYVPGLPVLTGHLLDGFGDCLPDTRRSDHVPFWDLGYTAMTLTDTADFRNPNYHTATDTLATVNAAFLTRVTQATAAYVATEVVVVPEPGTGVLVGIGLFGMAVRRRHSSR